MKKDEKILNKQQLKAIKHDQGPLLIIAGAGTGKTTVVTERIKYLISRSLAKPSEILALTFTQKAALEMEERVDQIMPYGFAQMWISTFHSFCDHILRDEALHIGLDPHYVLMSGAESLIFLKKHLFNFKLKYFRPAGNPFKFLNGLLTHFARLKDEDILPKDYLAYAEKLKTKKSVEKDEIKKTLELATAYAQYEKLKTKEGVMDFAGLISNTLKLFRKRKNVLNQYQKKFKYILVDEYQDTNIAQNELVYLLAGKEANLTVVADDDQAIYRFRGAAISNVLEFRHKYPKVKLVTLTKNYRSSQEILNRAHDLIQHNNPDRLEVKESIDKKLIAVRKAKNKQIVFNLLDRLEDEADWVVGEIKKIVSKNYQYKDIAILVRANNHADAFVRSFLRAGVPFQFLGPGKLLRQEEIKDLIAYLKVLYNFEDNVAFFRVLSIDIFNISARDIASLRNLARRSNFSLFEAAEKAENLNISAPSKEKIKKIIEMICRHLKMIPNQTAGQILYYFLDDTGLLQKMTEIKSQKQEEIVNNIAKFFEQLKNYEACHEEAGVEAVVDWLNLKMEIGESPLTANSDWSQANKVNILTVHSSKGLEFPVVFLVNLVTERFPTRRRAEQIPLPDDLIKEVLPEGDSHEQEERRLFYVAMTRAKDQLYFASAKFYAGAKRMKKISPFVLETLGQKAINSQQAKSINQQISIFDFQPQKENLTLLDEKVKTTNKINYLSYSQLDTFKRCPLQYKYRYIIGIPTPLSSPASLGISLHNTLKELYQHHQKSKKISLKKTIKLLNKNWLKEGYTSKEHEQKMFKRALKMIKDYWQKGYKKADDPISLEQAFTLKISPGLKIGGRIDRADRLKNGNLEIIDYKTGKISNKKQVDESLQMTFYAMAASNPYIFNTKPEEIILSFYFLEEQKKISTYRTQKDLEKTQKEIIIQAKEMEKSDFSPQPSPLCDFCDFKLLCPAWQ